MISKSGTNLAWPALPLDAWRETYATLHMWTQVVGKLCIAMTPLENHYWNVAFHLTSRGLTTRSMRTDNRTLTLEFDFMAHQLNLRCSDASAETVTLEPRTVADFYAAVMQSLRRLGCDVRIWTMPVEVPDPIRFEADTIHRSYEPAWANAFWRTLLAIQPVFERFRCGFIGKCSPVHFFWGSFDLAVTRFSGRRAPERPSADAVTREAYSHEVISHGFWPGGGAIQEPAFYAYAAPVPDGLRAAQVRPAAAFYSSDLGEFILPYETVRSAASPEKELSAFLDSTYEQASLLANWNRRELERPK